MTAQVGCGSRSRVARHVKDCCITRAAHEGSTVRRFVRYGTRERGAVVTPVSCCAQSSTLDRIDVDSLMFIRDVCYISIDDRMCLRHAALLHSADSSTLHARFNRIRLRCFSSLH